MLPINLANLILHYLNRKYFLLLTNLIKLVNDFYFYNLNDHIQTITTNFSKFTNISAVHQNIYGRQFVKLDVIKDGNIGKNFIYDFITIYLTTINQLDKNKNSTLINQTMLINLILFDFKFNDYLVLFYNDQTRQMTVEWFNKLVKN